MGIGAIVCNVVVFAITGVIIMIPFAVLAVGTPLLSAGVLLGGGRQAMRAPRPSTGGGG